MQGLVDTINSFMTRLSISPHTVRTHLQRLYAQHGLHNRAEAAATWMIGRRSPTEDVKPV